MVELAGMTADSGGMDLTSGDGAPDAGLVPTAATSDEKTTNEPEVDDNVRILQTQFIVEVALDSGVESRLDKTTNEPDLGLGREDGEIRDLNTGSLDGGGKEQAADLVSARDLNPKSKMHDSTVSAWPRGEPIAPPPGGPPPRRAGRKGKRTMRRERRELERGTRAHIKDPPPSAPAANKLIKDSAMISVEAFRNVQPADPQPP